MPWPVPSAPDLFEMVPPVQVAEEVQVPPLPVTTRPPKPAAVPVLSRRMPLADPPIEEMERNDMFAAPMFVFLMLTAVAVPELTVLMPVASAVPPESSVMPAAFDVELSIATVFIRKVPTGAVGVLRMAVPV